MITEPAGRNRQPATSAWNSCTEVESPHITWPGAAPISAPIRSPIRPGSVHQSWVFHEVIRSWPHCCSISSVTAGSTALGSAPSELPSR